MTDPAPLTVVAITDPLDTLIAAHDSTVAIIEEAQRRGHRVLTTTVDFLRIQNSRARARCRPILVEPAICEDGRWRARPDWWQSGDEVDVRLDDVDAVLMRTDPPVDRGYLRATYVLDQVDEARTLMVNSPSGLRAANEKLFTLRYPDLIPDTLVSADPGEIVAATRRWGRAVLKPTDAMAGRGIVQLRPDDPNLRTIVEISTDRGREHVIVQSYVDEADAGDRRIIVLGGEPVGVVRRVAVPGEFRCNMAAGAVPVADAVTPQDKALCDRIAPDLERFGIVLAGIDVLGDRLTEVNVTSPTGLREIDALTGSRLPRLVVEHIEDIVKGLRR